MDVSEEYQEVHSDASPVRRVVDVSLPEMPGEGGLLVSLIYQGNFDSGSSGLLCLFLDKVLGEDESLQLGDLPVSGSWDKSREMRGLNVNKTILPRR